MLKKSIAVPSLPAVANCLNLNRKEFKMKRILAILVAVVIVMSISCFGESLSITKTPTTLPSNLSLGQFSPMMEFTYSGLTNQEYTLKVWLLDRGYWYCASSQWCEATFIIDNSDGLNPSGELQVIKNMDVYNYSALDWVARLYDSSSSQVDWDEYYLNGVSNRPPVLASIPNQDCLVGGTISFSATATDPEEDTTTFSASNLPSGATLDAEGNFNWTPSAEGTYEIYIHADDGQTYDSQKVTLTIGPVEDLELEITSYPECGSTENVHGIVTGTTNYSSYRAICYIFIGGYGWVTKPYADTPKTLIDNDGTFEIDVTTGGIDELAGIIYIGVCHKDADIPVVIGGELPESLPVIDFQKIHRDPFACHRTIEWSGYTWWVKTSGEGALGPGPNYFNDTEQNVFIDPNGYLHMKIIYSDSVWECSEIVIKDTLGYGIYEFELLSGPSIDKNVVLGLFTWEDDVPLEYNREIDIELGQWADETNQNAQYVVQPWQEDGNMYKYDMPTLETPSIHRFYWNPEKIRFQSYFSPDDWITSGDIVADWLYTGDYIPASSQEKVRLNLWLVDGIAPSDGLGQEVVIKEFRYICGENVPGDINGDCKVNMIDLSILASNWLLIL